MINKIGKIIGVAIFLSLLSFQSNGQMFKEGDITGEVYIGGPNLLALALNIIFEQENRDVDITTVPLVGARAGYYIDDKVCVGFDVNYRSIEIEFEENIISDDQLYYYKIKIPQLRAALRAELHVDLEPEKLDLYFPATLGLKMTRLKLDTNDPNYIHLEKIRDISPFTMRVAVGSRYYITKNIGVGIELGIGGGGAIQGGLVIKV